MINERQTYRSYLVRLWQVHSGGTLVWRAAVESPHTGERQAFADLLGLFAYLERQTSAGELVEPTEDPLGEEEQDCWVISSEEFDDPPDRRPPVTADDKVNEQEG